MFSFNSVWLVSCLTYGLFVAYRVEFISTSKQRYKRMIEVVLAVRIYYLKIFNHKVVEQARQLSLSVSFIIANIFFLPIDTYLVWAQAGQ